MTIDAKPRVRTAIDMSRDGNADANGIPQRSRRPPQSVAINAQLHRLLVVGGISRAARSPSADTAVTVGVNHRGAQYPQVPDESAASASRIPAAAGPRGVVRLAGTLERTGRQSRGWTANAVAVIHIVVMPPAVAIIKPRWPGPTKARLGIAS